MGNVDLTRLTEKVTKGRWKTVFYEDAGGQIVAKQCRKCGEVEALESFNKEKGKLGGRKSECRECLAERYADNPEYYTKYYETKRNCEDFKRRKAERDRNWAQANPDKRAITGHNRRARKRILPDILTDLQREANYAHFGNACVLTGDSDITNLEHAIPLSTGHGGTTRENCVPMSASLNASKGDRNIFEWFPQVKERYGLSQRKFDELVTYLAKLNGLSPKEYEDFVYWCHDNPRSIEETEADNERYGYKKPSIEIWREFTQDKAIS